MTRILPLFAVLAIFPAGVALADDDCFVPMADWQPREAVAKLAAAKNWTVRRIKIDDGCYEIGGKDADGRAIEVKIHPGTLEIIGIEFEHEDDDSNQKRDNHKPDGNRSDDDK